MWIRVRRASQQYERRPDAVDTLLTTGGAILAGVGLFVLLLTVLVVLAPWLLLVGVLAMAAGELRRLLRRRRVRGEQGPFGRGPE